MPGRQSAAGAGGTIGGGAVAVTGVSGHVCGAAGCRQPVSPIMMSPKTPHIDTGGLMTDLGPSVEGAKGNQGMTAVIGLLAGQKWPVSRCIVS